MKITFISDTHNKHNHLTSKGMGNILGSGDVLVHAGDISSMGKSHEIKNFLDWFSNTDFTHKIFIAGNHDFGFELVHDIAPEYKEKGVHYLFDSEVVIDGVKFYGSPWQPEFYNWAFNLPRGEKLAEKWRMIPTDTDVLITHGPVYGLLDYAPMGGHVGCEELYKRVFEVKPKIHVCGHIHDGYGQKSIDGVEFLNASVLDERYEHSHKPIVVNFDVETKEVIGYES
jgi:Icc-related predicted phosphoesterase